MRAGSLFLSLSLLAALALVSAGCAEAGTLAARTPSPLAATMAAAPGPSLSPGAATPATAGRPAQATSTPAPPEAPTQAASPTPWVVRLPAGTIALLAVGAQEDQESLDLYALDAGGSATALGARVPRDSLASHDGRWLVCLDAPAPATRAVSIQNLQDGRSYTIPLGEECAEGNYCYADLWAFDREVTRLASAGVMTPDHWALTLVNLQDGSSRRFDPLQAESEGRAMMPGVPLGWAATGELVLDSLGFRGGWGAGVWALRLPDEGTPLPALVPARRLLAPGVYSSEVTLSPDGARLLYLARDPAYTPLAQEGWDLDMAVNQVWSLDVGSGKATRLAQVTDGGALAWAAAWSPDGREILFAQGRYDPVHGGWQMGSLVLKAVDAAGAVREIGPLAMPGSPSGLYWCRPGLALATTHDVWSEPSELYMVDLTTGRAAFVARGQQLKVLAIMPAQASPSPTPSEGEPLGVTPSAADG